MGAHNSNPHAVVCCENSDGCKYRMDRMGRYSRSDVFNDRGWNRDIPAINADLKESNNNNAVLGRNEFFVAGDYGYRSVD